MSQATTVKTIIGICTIHKTNSGRWLVSHQPTGLKVSASHCYRDAVQSAKRWMALPGFTAIQTAADVTPDLRQSARQLVDALRHDGIGY